MTCWLRSPVVAVVVRAGRLVGLAAAMRHAGGGSLCLCRPNSSGGSCGLRRLLLSHSNGELARDL